jgi:hypothetical protein
MQSKQSRRSIAGSPFKVDMAFHVHQQPGSGMIVSEYCTANQISEGSFYYWLKKIKNTAPAPLTTPAILPVKIMEAPHSHASNIFAEVRGITLFQPVPAEYLLALLNH